MIKVVIKKDVISVSGHAEFDVAGKDIVCASVSSIIYTSVNGIFNIDKNAIIFDDNKDNIVITIKHHSKVVDILINSMIDLLEDLEKEYPKNIKLVKESN